MPKLSCAPDVLRAAPAAIGTKQTAVRCVRMFRNTGPVRRIGRRRQRNLFKSTVPHRFELPFFYGGHDRGRLCFGWFFQRKRGALLWFLPPEQELTAPVKVFAWRL